MVLKKNKLKDYREKAGLTQEQLADVINVSRQTIISIERNKFVPSLEVAINLAKLFRCRIEDLFDL